MIIVGIEIILELGLFNCYKLSDNPKNIFLCKLVMTLWALVRIVTILFLNGNHFSMILSNLFLSQFFWCVKFQATTIHNRLVVLYCAYSFWYQHIIFSLLFCIFVLYYSEYLYNSKFVKTNIVLFKDLL